MSSRINWNAVAIHCVIALVIVAMAAAVSWAWTGVPLLGAVVAWLLSSLAFAAREAVTAAKRHDARLDAQVVILSAMDHDTSRDSTWRDGLSIVMRGEPGWSEWNLRLQAFAPAVVGFIVVLLVGGV